MHMRQETVTDIRLGGFVRNHNPLIGTLWCIGCASEQTINERDFTSASNLRDGDSYDSCEGCDRPINQCTPVEISGTAMIEYFDCKIF